jgi:hypothetical protein
VSLLLHPLDLAVADVPVAVGVRRVPALSGVPDVACASAVAVVPKYTVAGVPAVDGVPIAVDVFAAANAHVIRLQRHLLYKIYGNRSSIRKYNAQHALLHLHTHAITHNSNQ